jgi:hypothetical protein
MSTMPVASVVITQSSESTRANASPMAHDALNVCCLLLRLTVTMCTRFTWYRTGVVGLATWGNAMMVSHALKWLV